jgi:hypothetical protein
MSKNIRKIKNFNNIDNNNLSNEDVFLLSNENYLSLYNIYNIDDFYNFINKIINEIEDETTISILINNKIYKLDSLKNKINIIFDCWIINNMKTLNIHNSYFINLIISIIENIFIKEIKDIKKYKNYESTNKSYIFKFLKYWISLNNKFPFLNDKYFIIELIKYLEKKYKK